MDDLLLLISWYAGLFHLPSVIHHDGMGPRIARMGADTGSLCIRADQRHPR